MNEKIMVSDSNVVVAFLLFLMIKLASSSIFRSCDSLRNSKDDHRAKCYFGHNISISVEDAELRSERVTNNTGQIRCFLQVCAISDAGMKKRVLGYGSVLIPVDCGDNDFNVQTCRLVASQYRSYRDKLIFILNDHFFGCALGGIEKMTNLFMNSTSTQMDDSKPSFRKMSEQIASIPSGTVQLSVRIASKRASHNTDKNESKRVRYMLDEVLSKVRRQKRSGIHQYIPNHDDTSVVDDTAFDQTQELLCRVKARKEKRLHYLR